MSGLNRSRCHFTSGTALVLALLAALPSVLPAQAIDGSLRIVASIEWVPVKLTITRPVVRQDLVSETAYTTRDVTSTRPTWTTETRYRESVRKVPVERERIISQTQTVERPVMETAYEERAVTETVMRDVTETQQQRYVVQRPVTRTEYRDETVAVDRPVERTVLQAEDVTTYRPVTQTQTVYSQGLVPVQQPATVVGGASPYLQWQNRGWIADPVTGQQVWQRGGMHWVRKEPVVCQAQTSYLPVLMPQQQTSTAYVPEVTRQFKPVTVTGTTRQYETRRVPYSVQATEEAVEIRDVPVTVRKPEVVTRIEQVPVNRLRYEQQTVTQQIPVRETVYEEVREQVPYEVQVLKEVSETSTEQVPHMVHRWVNRESVESVVREVYIAVPLDENSRRTVNLPSELSLTLTDPAARIPERGAVLDLEWLKAAMNAPRAVTETSTPPATDSGAQKITLEDFSAVPPKPETEGSSVLANEPTPATGPDPAVGELQRGIEPDASKPAADKVPALEPDDGT